MASARRHQHFYNNFHLGESAGRRQAVYRDCVASARSTIGNPNQIWSC